MISKELYMEVMGLSLVAKSKYMIDGVVETFTIKDNEIIFSIFYESNSLNETGLHSSKNINIYELAHKCKEWAMTKERTIWSGWDYGVGKFVSMIGEHGVNELINNDADTEPEAIFKACDYILKETTK